MIPQLLVLDEDLNGRPPYASDAEDTMIPKGSEVLVLDYDHTLTEALVEFNGVQLRVKKEVLEQFGKNSDLTGM